MILSGIALFSLLHSKSIFSDYVQYSILFTIKMRTIFSKHPVNRSQRNQVKARIKSPGRKQFVNTKPSLTIHHLFALKHNSAYFFQGLHLVP